MDDGKKRECGQGERGERGVLGAAWANSRAGVCVCVCVVCVCVCV